MIHDITIPCTELEAVLMNASTGFVVSKSSGDLHIKKLWKLTDSQVVLHWLNCTMWVRNRVVEITRLVDPSSWYYVNSENMVAEPGKGQKLRI